MSSPPGARLPPAAALVRLSFLVQSIYATIAAAHDLTPQQAQMLCVVKDQPRGITELTHMLRLEKSSVSGLVDRVAQHRLVARAASPLDKRAVVVGVTAAGKRVADAFYTQATESLVAILEPLGHVQQAEFTELATQLVLAQEVPAVFGVTP